MRTKNQDRYLGYLNAAVDANPDHLRDYIWGAEGDNADHSRDGDPEWDCSGLFHAALKAAGYPDSRDTANGYKNRGHKISGPSQIGDFRLHVDGTGRATHIIMWTGGEYTVEARGKDYGIVRRRLNETTGPWYRIEAVNAYLSAGLPPYSGETGALVADVRRERALEALELLRQHGFDARWSGGSTVIPDATLRGTLLLGLARIATKALKLRTLPKS